MISAAWASASFGTIYEGLLESELSVADEDLTWIGKANTSRPASKNPTSAKGRSICTTPAARKATGSYYTKIFAVEHLLDHALEPAIADHLARLDKLDDRRAAESFFDFRVADIAMGSGHFLVAAVDRIERRFSSYLGETTAARRDGRIARLRTAASTALSRRAVPLTALRSRTCSCFVGRLLGGASTAWTLTTSPCNWRRLSLWIHTFVPGLPLSFLDHNIVCGNSLVGIATFEEVSRLIEQADCRCWTAVPTPDRRC